MVSYSVIIPAYNEEALLPQTLEALGNSMRTIDVAGEVIVVDNNSSDGTARLAAEWGAAIVFEPHNQISRARNAGLSAARGKYLIFLDADTNVSPEILAEAIGNLDDGGCCGGGSVLQFDLSTSKAQSAVDLWNWISVKFGLAAGSFVYCLREGFEAVGGFSERVYAGEEIWFSRDLKAWGRQRSLDFRILRGTPVVTSGRKLEWHSTTSLILQAGFLLIFPVGTRFRTFCGNSYKRPEGREKEKSERRK